MTRVDFYILPEQASTSSAPLAIACRLCDKATATQQYIYVYVPEKSMADALDGMLWSFRQGSFVAHERYLEGSAIEQPLPPVLIGSDPPPDSHHQVMINLGADVPPFFSRFDRVLELVHGDTSERAVSRSRFKFYRDRGYELTTHNLTADAGLR